MTLKLEEQSKDLISSSSMKLKQKQAELDITRDELRLARDEISDMKDFMKTRDNELKDNSESVAMYEHRMAQLEEELFEANTKVTDMETKMHDLTNNLKEAEALVKTQEQQLSKLTEIPTPVVVDYSAKRSGALSKAAESNPKLEEVSKHFDGVHQCVSGISSEMASAAKDFSESFSTLRWCSFFQFICYMYIYMF